MSSENITTYMLIPSSCARALIGEPDQANPNAPVTHNWPAINEFSNTSPFVFPSHFAQTPYLAIEWKGPEEAYKAFRAELLKQSLLRCANCALKQKGLCNGANIDHIAETTHNPNLLVVRPRLINPRNN